MPSQKVTVLIIELPGFAEQSVKLEAKELQTLLNSLEELANATVRLHQGVVSSFSGDSFTAVFSGPKPGASAGMPALEACQEFRERMELLMEEKGFSKTMGFKAGIATAEAIITGLNQQDNSKVAVMGPAVTFAGRLKDFAENNQVLADSRVFQEAKERFDFIHLEPLPVRGSKEQLEVYELKGKKRAKLKLDVTPERKIASEMVGRTSEMELVEGQVKKLLSGKGAVVNIIGKAGIGKSRLVAELMAQDFMKKAMVLEGRALSMGQNLSFHPIIHIIKSWAGIREEDHLNVPLEKLHRAIHRAAPDQSDEIFPFIATMMGLTLSGKDKERMKGIEGEALEKLILKNLRDLITKAASIWPLIILIEDMHWADSSTITFLESLFKLARANPVMFINIFRPGYESTGDYLVKYLEVNLKEDHLNIFINALTEKESRLLIENLLQQTPLPPEINDIIIRKTEGNPFFIEEVIRSFIDEGVVEVRDNGLRVTGKINDVNIPDTINEVILSRVDKLDEKTKELLKTASVIGRNFYYKVLEEAADTIGELGDRLKYLKEVQLINESRKKDDIEYLFKHALAQQATYESIVLKTKKELHLKIAQSIEKVFSENLNEFYGTLAYHYEKAENWEKTEEYLVKAGDEAMNTGAYAEAINFYFDVFLKLKNRQDSTSESGKFLEVEEKLSYAYYADGQNVKSAEHFNKVLRSYNLTAMPKGRMLNSLSMIRDMLILRFRIKFWNGKISRENRSEDNKLMKMLLYRNEAIATYSPKEAFIQGMYCISRVPMGVLTGTDYGAGALIELSTVFPWSGRSIGLGRLLNKFAWRIIDRNNTHIWLIYIYVGVMFEYFTDRLIPESEHEKAFKFGMETGQVWAPTIYHSFKCISLVDQGLKEKSENVLKSMKILVTSLENSLSLVQYYRAQQTYLLKFRKLEEVIGNAGEFIGYCVKTDHKTMLLLNYCLASMAFCLKNDIQQAWFFYYKAEELQKTLWLNYYVSITLLTKAFIELGELRSGNKNANGESHIGFSKTTKSLVKASKKVNCTKTEAYRFRALYFQLTGKKKSALKYYSKSIDFAQWYGARLELSRTYFELGKFLSDSKTGKTKFNGLTGEDYLKRAQTMFEETGLEWDLEQYRKYSN